jgi:hypothetical protein
MDAVAFARLMQGDVRTLPAEFRLGLADSLPEEKRNPAVASVPLQELEADFFRWLDESAAGAPVKKIKAFNVCLYEGMDYFEADFFGCPAYSATDPDWATRWCHEGKRRFVLNSDDIEPEWETGLKVAKRMFAKYLKSSNRGAKIIQGVGIATLGFSDGDLHLVLGGKKKATRSRGK